ncbi:MAG: hypothetical protein JWM99_5187 [Verrucomicrobiales bacterium]|nr:hypothetical protein [Verrucomicrobiales bacterium]
MNKHGETGREQVSVNPKEGARWKLFETFFFVATLWIPLLVGSMAFFSKNDGFSVMTPSQRLSSFAAAGTLSLFTWCIRLGCERFPIIRTNRIRDAILVPVLLWLVVLAFIIMPRHDFTLSQRSVVSLWGFAPCGILIGWCWGFTAAKRKGVGVACSY